MTNERAISYLSQMYIMQFNEKEHESLTIAIDSIQENDKLKAEVEQLSGELKEWVDMYTEHIARHKKEIEQLKEDYSVLSRQYNNVENSSIRYYNEAKQLKSELEQSVKLPCKVGDNLYRPVPRLYKDIAKMKVKGFKIDEYGFMFETTKGTEWNCSSIGKTIFLSQEEAEQHLKVEVENSI